MKKIVFATGNKGKLKEASEIFRNYEIISIKEFKKSFNPEETGKTFLENAVIKAEAAKDTAKLIEVSIDNSEAGVKVNREVSEKLEAINNQINKVTEMMETISNASVQQTQGIEQINTSVDQMNQTTQQMAANSEESASIAEELSSQSSQMQQMVSAFHLDEGNMVDSIHHKELVQHY